MSDTSALPPPPPSPSSIARQRESLSFYVLRGVGVVWHPPHHPPKACAPPPTHTPQSYGNSSLPCASELEGMCVWVEGCCSAVVLVWFGSHFLPFFSGPPWQRLWCCSHFVDHQVPAAAGSKCQHPPQADDLHTLQRSGLCRWQGS